MDQEPEPQYAWHSMGPYPVEMMIQGDQRWYRIYADHWLPLTDQLLESWDWVKTETQESRIARLEWRVRQLEAELENRQEWQREMQERE